MKCKLDKIKIIKHAENLSEQADKETINQHLKTCPECREFLKAYQSFTADLQQIKPIEKSENFWIEMKKSIMDKLSVQHQNSGLFAKLGSMFTLPKRVLIGGLVSLVLIFLFASYLYIHTRMEGDNFGFTSLSDADIDMMLIYNGYANGNKDTTENDTDEIDSTDLLLEPIQTENANKNDSLLSTDDKFYLELLDAKEIIASL